MDQTSPPDAWGLSQLGNAIGVLVDRELNKPTAISSTTNFGIDEQGRLYTLGQPAGQVVAQTSTVGGGKPVNSQLLLLILIGAFIASRQ